MHKFVLLFSLAACLSAFVVKDDFLKEQKSAPRVSAAYAEKETLVKATLQKQGYSLKSFNMLIVAYKDEQLFEIFVKKTGSKKYSFLKSYDICSKSGVLGPKRKIGDRQVPEGFYHIDRFNPASSYYLSLGLNYPNKSDLEKKTAKDPGGDIFIHGECVTIGCMPMTNDKIKEIYIYALEAHSNGQKQIPVYVFPFKMTETKTKDFYSKYKSQPELIAFWKNIKRGYDLFHETGEQLSVGFDKNGNYTFR